MESVPRGGEGGLPRLYAFWNFGEQIAWHRARLTVNGHLLPAACHQISRLHRSFALRTYFEDASAVAASHDFRVVLALGEPGANHPGFGSGVDHGKQGLRQHAVGAKLGRLGLLDDDGAIRFCDNRLHEPSSNGMRL